MHIIDFHAHIYPDKIAVKASKAIGNFYSAPIRYNGFIQELLKSGSAIGVERYVVHSTATKAEQVESINNFIIQEISKEPSFVGFGTMHPDFKDYAYELDRIAAAGLRGIKLHPDFQKFEADATKMDDIYECIAEKGMPVLFHAGDCRYDFSGPRRIAHVLDKHPSLKVIAAHFGGYTEWDEAYELLAGRNLWFDTSSTLWKLPTEKAIKIINKHGYKNFFFGSDFPMWDHSEELKRFLSLGLTEEENKAILYDNAAVFLDLLAEIK